MNLVEKFSVRQGLLDIKKQIDELQAKGWDSRQIRRKRKLYLKQRGKCCFCKKMMYACFETSPVKTLAATREHVIPRSKAQGIPNNLVVSCNRCNAIRGVIDFYTFQLMALFVPYEKLKAAARSPQKYGFST